MFEIEVRPAGISGTDSLSVVNNTVRAGVRFMFTHVECGGTVAVNNHSDATDVVNFSCLECEKTAWARKTRVITAFHAVLINGERYVVGDVIFVPHPTD